MSNGFVSGWYPISLTNLPRKSHSLSTRAKSEKLINVTTGEETKAWELLTVLLITSSIVRNALSASVL
jgi:hypothetical protein